MIVDVIHAKYEGGAKVIPHVRLQILKTNINHFFKTISFPGATGGWGVGFHPPYGKPLKGCFCIIFFKPN